LPRPVEAVASEDVPSAEIEVIEIEPSSGRLVRRSVPWLLSMIVHQIGLIVLALLAVSGMMGGGGDSVALNAHFAVEGEDLLDDSTLAAEIPELELERLDETNFEPAEMAVPSSLVASNYAIERISPSTDMESSPWVVDARNLMEKLGGVAKPSLPDAGQVREADSVEGATGGVVGDILGQLAEGDLLVVWLLDQSISLHDDRQRVAAKLSELFRQTHEEAQKSGHVFKNAAVAFGAKAEAMVPPTDSTDDILRAVSRVPTDESGLERVFAAVSWAARQYSRRWHERILIVVWTDESGDDAAGLEDAVKLCKSKNISVSIVGPSAILGRQTGLHTWVHRPTGKVFHLEVTRGPDSALPERFLLPYWWPTQMLQTSSSSFVRPVAHGDSLPPWYGGEQLEGLVSGMGPYALTRLALETRGTYTIFDRPLDRGPFRVDRMRSYAPDYRDAETQLSEMRYRPLPRAVLQAVEILANSSPAVQPKMDFFGAGYRSPPAFRNDLKDALKLSAAQALAHLQVVQNALAAFGANGMEKEYETEKSLRYRAWYDVTRGRLLAISVRYLEYVNGCGLTLPSLTPATNRVTFVPSGDLLCGSTSRLAAEEAERLLTRCLHDHADTPWAYLAQRELDYSFGIGLRQSVIPPPPPPPPKIMGPAPVGPPIMPRRAGGGGGGGAIVPPKL